MHYMKLDVFILSDFMENFRKTCLKYYNTLRQKVATEEEYEESKKDFPYLIILENI